MRVLVCGDREYLDYISVHNVLKHLVEDFIETTPGATIDDFVVIQGGAKGADFLAKVWCYCYTGGWFKLRCEEYPANWKKYGKGAGPIRNQQMLDEGKPDLVVAFPGNDGTADMVARAKEAGVKVIEVAE